MLEGGEYLHGLGAEELDNLGKGGKEKFELPPLDDPNHGYDIKGAEDTIVEGEDVIMGGSKLSGESTLLIDLNSLEPEEGKRRIFADPKDETRVIDLGGVDRTAQIKIPKKGRGRN